MIQAIKKHWQEWRHQRLLRDKGWTQKMYDRYNDPDCNPGAMQLSHYYHGYPYYIVVESAQDWNRRFGTWNEGLRQATAWCEEHCEDKFREDIMRGMKAGDDWYLNDLNGDIMVWAFKNQKDYTNFLLKWI